MKNVGSRADAIAQHYYVRGNGNWTHKGSATEFDEREWFALMKNTLEVDEVIRRDKEIMDKYDPRGRVALYVDEWGTWWDEEPGTKGGFLYQQNTLRDALSAGLFLNVFNAHCDRVKMGNIAQTVNVLQAMVLTDGPKMVVTPTYHVFEMYKVHQGGKLLATDLKAGAYKLDNAALPALHASASKAADGKIHITVCNLDPNNAADLKCDIQGGSVRKAEGRTLTAGSMNAHNTFDEPSAVTPATLEKIRLKGNTVQVTLPPMSVSVLTLQ